MSLPTDAAVAVTSIWQVKDLQKKKAATGSMAVNC
jgi:hypothetical protein